MRRTVFAEGEYYHIYNRGVEKRAIFAEPKEYKRFLTYLAWMNDQESTRLTYDFKIEIDEAKPRQLLNRL